ncbi:hypothetical protein COCON_G00186200 [Conger conger]|uniref:Nuclear mitotic apparatus protein 1 N-terminal hook domain-containing protein n=1 Tax=Conger conger TaxID=82655 RepID=A0A9Q1D3D7_CONCO|nr:hypothetical protein COCON_G00186200 [Conger conger]
MALHRQKEDVLLAWINSLRLADPINSIALLHDGILFLKLICKLNGQEEQCLLDQPIQERFAFVSEFVERQCRYKADRGSFISWDNILNGKNADMELSKVVMLLVYHTSMNELVVTDNVDRKMEFQMAAVLRFVFDKEDSLHLGDNLEDFLKKPFTVALSSVSSISSSSDESPILNRQRRPEVKFLELTTVASSSARSPIQEVINTPQFQLRKVRRQLAEERDMRDELERDLANTSELLSEKETQLSQLQHRLQRLMRDNAEQKQEPSELEELQNKNEGLLERLHEVLKQCHDLKTNKGQMEKKIDQLTEENGDLSVEVRDMAARLSSAQMMADTLSEEQQASQAEWESKKTFFETELCQAVSEKEILSEQIEILRGKISVLEDELSKAQAQSQEQGEVMGPIMKWERLNHEISELTCKLSQLQERIIQLEREKGEMQTKHENEKNKFESETSRLQGLISELKQTLCVLRGEREALEQTSREQQAVMATQITAMNAEIACLSEIIHSKELAATALGQQVAEEQKQRGILVEKMEKRDQMNEVTILALNQQVEHLETTLKSKEEEHSHQQAILQETSESAIQERDTILVEYRQFRQEKEEQVVNLNQQEEHAAKLQQKMVALRHKNEELLSIREVLQKEQEASQKLTADLAGQLQLAREELSTLRPLREQMAETSQLSRDLQEQLSLKAEALEHYKSQVENAKMHYNGKKQLVLEANEKIHTITTSLEAREQEVKTLKGQIKAHQLELEQAKATENNLRLNVNSLQAQLDYADKQLREQRRHGKCETKPKETIYQKVNDKPQDTSGDSLDLSLDDSLNSTRRPSKREESSTPMVRSSERLQAKRRARGGESLETLYFTPMSVRNAADVKLESSINSLGELTLDSTKKSSARRRTTQVINITMTKKTPGRVEADPEDGSFCSLQSAQSFPNLASQRGRPFSVEFPEEATSDQLRNLPGYRRSAAYTVAPTRSISTFRVGAENEPDFSEEWMRIAELQARNKACLPHLKSSYPIESQPVLGIPSFTITDDDLKTGDPNETIRRASMMPGQIRDSVASHRHSMLPGQIRDGSLSRRETMQPGDSWAASRHTAVHPKRCPSNAQNGRAATLPLKRGGGDLQGPDTPEAKKLVSCFPRPMTPKERGDRRFASQNSQNLPPNTPVDRRQSMVFSIENTPKKNGKSNLLQKGFNKMRASTRKSPGSTSKATRSTKSPRPGKSPHGEKPQRKSPRINSNKSPKVTSSARKNVSAHLMECVFVQREEMALETEQQPS